MKIETLNLKYGSFRGVIFFERDFGIYIDLYAVDDDGLIYYRCKDAHESKKTKFEQIDILVDDHLKSRDLDEFRDAFNKANLLLLC